MKTALYLMAILFPVSIAAQEKKMDHDAFQPSVARQFLEAARKNPHWKTSFLTGENAQIVFMNISPETNPKNEVGVEVHPFDQVIFIVEGDGKLQLNEETSSVHMGDLVFIPAGTKHNLINLDSAKALKIFSFYSENDMPKDTTYKKQADEPEE